MVTSWSPGAIALLALGGCRAKAAGSNLDATPIPAPPVASVSASASTPALPTCAPIDRARMPKPDPTVAADYPVPLPPIVDPEGKVLRRLHVRLAELLRGRAKDHLRIGVYGDSNLTLDQLTGEMRRVGQGALGDGGHGFVAAGQPWAWYRHEDVHHGTTRVVSFYAPTTHPAPDPFYGFASIAIDATMSATTWVETATAGSTVGAAAGRFEIFYLARPWGGAFHARVDGKDLPHVVDTQADKTHAGFYRVDVPDGPHKVEWVVDRGAVRFFGTALERDAPGFVVDSLGAGALGFGHLVWVDGKTRGAQVGQRKWALATFILGSNMFVPTAHEEWVEKTIASLRTDDPDLPVLLVGPPDLVQRWDRKPDPRLGAVTAQLREIAGKHGHAFWDLQAAMGGPGAMLAFAERKLGTWDLVHFSKEGAAVMGRRLLAAVLATFEPALAANPRLGCD